MEHYEEIELPKTDCRLMYGPPFPTGKPHYGHVINVVLKDIILAYFKRFGCQIAGDKVRFDVHGLPTEMAVQKEIQKQTGQAQSPDELVEQLGLAGYNERCRQYLLKVIQDWVPCIDRLTTEVKVGTGSTMDFSYMNSLFTLFSELDQKGLVYLGMKVQPYSAECQTAVSKFEAKQNRRELKETSIYLLFPIEQSEQSEQSYLRDYQNLNFLVWTTTPFTLFSNTALCVNSAYQYAVVYDMERDLNLVCLEEYFKNSLQDEKFQLKEVLSGSSLVGIRYKPVFDENPTGYYQVLSDGYVDNSGTGVVHMSPLHGEDDFRVCLQKGVIQKDGTGGFDPTDAQMCFRGLEQHPEFNGRDARSCNEKIIKLVEDGGLLFKRERISHDIPFCWRTDKPLYFKAVESVYLDIEKLIPRMKELIQKVNFVNEIGRDRMISSVEMAPDWCLSRSRLWGTPIPLWVNREDRSDYFVVRSAEELEELTGAEKGSITDLHTDKIFNLEIKRAGKVYEHIRFVFDCWFESGSQFYAENGYPHLSTEIQKPVDFILEGMDQTRGWFYTLLVLSTAIRDEVPYKNLIMNGIILAKDGRKMSKRDKNYKDVDLVLGEYGTDAPRLYLVSSNATKGLSFKFQEELIREIRRRVLIPFINSAKFYREYLDYFFQHYGGVEINEDHISTHYCDVWLELQTRVLAEKVVNQVSRYNLYYLGSLVEEFVYKLSHKYIRHGRDRFKLKLGRDTAMSGLATLGRVLQQVCCLLYPVLPETVEEIWSLVKSKDDEREVKQLAFAELRFRPKSGQNLRQERVVDRLYDVITTVTTFRSRKRLPVKRPLKKVLFGLQHSDMELIEEMQPFMEWLLTEINAFELDFVDLDKTTVVKMQPDPKVMGKRYGKASKERAALIEKNSDEIISAFQSSRETSYTTESGFTVQRDEANIVYQYLQIDGYTLFTDNGVSVYIDEEYNRELEERFIVRFVINELQKYRKELDFKITDRLEPTVWTHHAELHHVLSRQLEQIRSTLRQKVTLVEKEEVVKAKEVSGDFNYYEVEMLIGFRLEQSD